MQSVSNKPRLLLVYNADSGVLNMLKDAVWKIASPATYPCSLCAITYGPVSMRSDWRRFLASLPLDIVFHHKDDFAGAYPGHDIALPAILLARDADKPSVLVADADLDAITDTSALMGLVEERLVDKYSREHGLKISV